MSAHDEKDPAHDLESKKESGQPGGGAGRRDEASGSGVYPASAGSAPADAEPRSQAAWGQGERGAAGYEDSGNSEIFFTEAELKAIKEARRSETDDESSKETDR
jgi:hypothetical protein